MCFHVTFFITSIEKLKVPKQQANNTKLSNINISEYQTTIRERTKNVGPGAKRWKTARGKKVTVSCDIFGFSLIFLTVQISSFSFFR